MAAHFLARYRAGNRPLKHACVIPLVSGAAYNLHALDMGIRIFISRLGFDFKHHDNASFKEPMP